MAKKRKAAASTPEAIRERLLAERRAAVEELARLGLTLERDEAAGSGDSPFEAGDVAQASEQIDMSFAQRERVAGASTGSPARWSGWPTAPMACAKNASGRSSL